jgi:carbonic anhydrase
MNIPTELRAGYSNFRSGRYVTEADRYRAVATNQRPKTMVIACADSRVDPATIFSAAPGELFVVRNVAALVPPCESQGTYHGTSAALEFAVTQLKVESIVVMGHGMCGGITAALKAAEHRPIGQFIGPWMEQIASVRDELIERTPGTLPEIRQQSLERMAIQHSLGNLMTFPFLKQRVEQGELHLHGAWFSIAEGELHWLDWDTGVFKTVPVVSPDRRPCAQTAP